MFFFSFWGELPTPKGGQLWHCAVMQSPWLLHSLFPAQEIAAVSCYSENFCGIAAGGREGSSALQDASATELWQAGGTSLASVIPERFFISPLRTA